MNPNQCGSSSGVGAAPPNKGLPVSSRAITSDSNCPTPKKKKSLKEIFEELWDRHKLRGIVLEKEFHFHTSRKWRLDYAIPRLKIAVELDGFGGLRKAGRHQTVFGISTDHEKHNSAAELGWLVLHFDSRLLGSKAKREEAIEQLRRIITKRQLSSLRGLILT